MSGQRPHQKARREYRGTGLYWSLMVSAVLGLAILVGIIQNGQTVELKYVAWDVRTPLIVVLLITIGITAAFTELVGVVWRWRRRRQLTAREEMRELLGRGESPAIVPALPPRAEIESVPVIPPPLPPPFQPP